MPNVSRIHQNKQPIRRHFIGEWLEARRMTPSDLLEALNDPDRFSDFQQIDKSQVYRWLKGQLPHPPMQKRIADALGLDAPTDLLRHPDDDWLAKFFRDRDREEIERIKKTLESAFPRKTGTSS